MKRGLMGFSFAAAAIAAAMSAGGPIEQIAVKERDLPSPRRSKPKRSKPANRGRKAFLLKGVRP